ncbi:MAG TPA: proteasome assembly chaperone family protein [Candidatus Bathyarchaeota archaeon]|nr:proteasome assembly chaperone family protein [Candidatus Bathyarchaeota archaeon]
MLVLGEEVHVVEKEPIKPGQVVVVGLPDVGLVGVIATHYLISKLGLREVAYIRSDLLPPIAVLHGGLPHSPVRIFGDDGLLVIFSEAAVPADAVAPLSRAIVEWCRSKEAKLIISLSGIPVPNRQDIEEPSVFGAASLPETLEVLRKHDVGILESGIMVGPYALILRYCAEAKIPALVLTAQCFFSYPDPEASAAILAKLSKILGIEIDTEELIRKGEEIRLRARDIMRRTQMELAKMRKAQELDIPLYA